MSPRTWLWIGVVLLLVGVFQAITRGGLATPYGVGYMAGSVLFGVAVIYFGWYRRRGR